MESCGKWYVIRLLSGNRTSGYGFSVFLGERISVFETEPTKLVVAVAAALTVPIQELSRCTYHWGMANFQKVLKILPSALLSYLGQPNLRIVE